MRTSKHDPLVDEVELLEANTHYAHVRLNVSNRKLAPWGEIDNSPLSDVRGAAESSTIEPRHIPDAPQNSPPSSLAPEERRVQVSDSVQADGIGNNVETRLEIPGLRRSVRIRKEPNSLTYS